MIPTLNFHSLNYFAEVEYSLPERIAGHPRTNNGKGCQIFANGDIKGANKQPTLEIVAHAPTAWVLKFVGYNSEVTKNTIVKATADDAFPNK